MTTIGWLHLADLHQTLTRPGWAAPQPRRRLFDDLATLHRRCGPWDLVVVAGDLTAHGTPDELEEAGLRFDMLLDHLRDLGSSPTLLVVPGNHDFVRTQGSPSAYRALSRWHDEPEIRHEFWNDPESPTRRLVDRALEPFEHWWKGRAASIPGLRHGLLPGDFTVTIQKDDVRLGVAGLCSTFLQVTGDDYQGHLSLSPHQLSIAAGGDVPAWVANHDMALLVTHHPPSWLAPEDRRAYETVINPAGRFCAHLSAHLHESSSLIQRCERVQIRTSSLHGLSTWEDLRGRPGDRRYGYVAACVTIKEDESRLHVYPRQWSESKLRFEADLDNVDAGDACELDVARFPKLEKWAPAFMPERAMLRDALARRYRSADDARSCAKKIGLSNISPARGGSPLDLWHVVVTQAEAARQLASLVQGAMLDHPGDDSLPDAWLAWLRATNRQSVPDAIRSGSAEEKLANELYEKLATIQPAVFETIVLALGLTDGVPGSSAPQATRAIAAVQLAEKGGRAGLERLLAVFLWATGKRPSNAPAEEDDEYSWLPWVLIVAGGLAAGAGVYMLMNSGAKRVPSRSTLAKLLTLMFSDERDFNGFVLDHFPSVYRTFTNGMTRAYRIGLLLKAAQPSDVVARLKRAHPAEFAAHERVLDYEDES
ncbi:MAG: effector-associated domain EAD1-containing protein [Byssovorax sp.]